MESPPESFLVGVAVAPLFLQRADSETGAAFIFLFASCPVALARSRATVDFYGAVWVLRTLRVQFSVTPPMSRKL